MEKEHPIIQMVCAAKEDNQAADDLIRTYLPFIRSEAAAFLGRPCTDQDDEYSIAMIAFHEAILGYSRSRGSFLPYASLLIKSRLTDHSRKEARHRGHLSLQEPDGEDDRTLLDTLADSNDHYARSAHQEATRQELEELSAVMAQFGIGFSDVADNSPRQDRTLAACGKAVRYAAANPELLQELLRSKKLPITALAVGAGVERKTLERHRKYILAMLLIQTNGYEIIRGHICHVLQKGGSRV